VDGFLLLDRAFVSINRSMNDRTAKMIPGAPKLGNISLFGKRQFLGSHHFDDDDDDEGVSSCRFGDAMAGQTFTFAAPVLILFAGMLECGNVEHLRMHETWPRCTDDS
jgi:hypothetical protein